MTLQWGSARDARKLGLLSNLLLQAVSDPRPSSNVWNQCCLAAHVCTIKSCGNFYNALRQGRHFQVCRKLKTNISSSGQFYFCLLQTPAAPTGQLTERHCAGHGAQGIKQNAAGPPDILNHTSAWSSGKGGGRILGCLSCCQGGPPEPQSASVSALRSSGDFSKLPFAIAVQAWALAHACAWRPPCQAHPAPSWKALMPTGPHDIFDFPGSA